MPKWKPGESGRPPVRRWSEEEIRAFQAELRTFRERLGYSHRELEEALGYHSQGRLAKLYEGYYNTDLHQPSEEFVRRFRALQAANPQPKPPWAPALIYEARSDSFPMARIEGRPRQCLECLAQFVEGRRQEKDIWFIPGHPLSRYCPEHKGAGAYRRRWFRRCRELECPYLVEIFSLDGASTYGCSALHCPLRRKSWPYLADSRLLTDRREEALSEDYADVPEAAQRLGLSRTRVRQLLLEHRLPGIKIGGKWWIRKEILERFAATYNPEIVDRASGS